MKIKSLILLLCVIFVSCEKKEMKISKADATIESQVLDQSPIYITKAIDGTVKMNEKNRIGNTNWVFSIENNLKVGDVLPMVQKMIRKKYDSGMHEDSKKVYFLYLDTIAEKMAYLPVHNFEFEFNVKNQSNSFSREENIEAFVQKMVNEMQVNSQVKENKILISIY